MKTKSMLLLSLFLLGSGVLSSQKKRGRSGESEEVNMVAEYKAKSREKLKPHKYDGTKITFFKYNVYEQKKTLEVLMFNGIDYKFCLNTDGVPKGITIRIYDKNDTSKNRILLYEQAGVSKRDLTILSKELQDKLDSEVSGAYKLKKLYIEYIIPVTDRQVEAQTEETEDGMSNPDEKGVVVISYGYKNV